MLRLHGQQTMFQGFHITEALPLGMMLAHISHIIAVGATGKDKGQKEVGRLGDFFSIFGSIPCRNSFVQAFMTVNVLGRRVTGPGLHGWSLQVHGQGVQMRMAQHVCQATVAALGSSSPRATATPPAAWDLARLHRIGQEGATMMTCMRFQCCDVPSPSIPGAPPPSGLAGPLCLPRHWLLLCCCADSPLLEKCMLASFCTAVLGCNKAMELSTAQGHKTRHRCCAVPTQPEVRLCTHTRCIHSATVSAPMCFSPAPSYTTC